MVGFSSYIILLKFISNSVRVSVSNTGSHVSCIGFDCREVQRKFFVCELEFSCCCAIPSSPSSVKTTLPADFLSDLYNFIDFSTLKICEFQVHGPWIYNRTNPRWRFWDVSQSAERWVESNFLSACKTKCIALDTKSLTNPNMKAGAVTLLMQGPTPPLRPKLASPQPTLECKQVSQQQPAQPRKIFFSHL